MKNRVQKGSITVFLSLLLLLLISLITTSLESAHLAAVRSQIGMGSEAAMYTLLSHFENSLYEGYKLLFLNDRLDFDGILTDEIELYEKTGEGGASGNNHLRFHTKSASVIQKVYLMDNNGEAFQAEVNQILASDLLARVKTSISGNITKLSQSGIITEYMNRIIIVGQLSRQIFMPFIMNPVNVCSVLFMNTLSRSLPNDPVPAVRQVCQGPAALRCEAAFTRLAGSW